MRSPIVTRSLRTSHADISIRECRNDEFPVLLIHGNSCSKDVFNHQFESTLARKFRLIAVDLPGHGQSSDAHDPERTYSFPGYAATILEVADLLQLERFAIVGWSLGGHIALEIMAARPSISGVMITGTPPIGYGLENIMLGFLPHPDAMLIGKPELTEEELEKLQAVIAGDTSDVSLAAAIRRADGRARGLMMASCIAGNFANERDLVGGSPVPLAIVDGACDPIINVKYAETLAYRNLWGKKCHTLAGAGHMPFSQSPAMFNRILGRFLSSMTARDAGTDRALLSA